jgi:hypothetical protein
VIFLGRMTGGELRLTECKSDEAIRFNAGVCWVGWQSRPTDHGNSRRIIVIYFEFGSGIRGSHHPEGKVLEEAVMRVCY